MITAIGNPTTLNEILQVITMREEVDITYLKTKNKRAKTIIEEMKKTQTSFFFIELSYIQEEAQKALEQLGSFSKESTTPLLIFAPGLDPYSYILATESYKLENIIDSVQKAEQKRLLKYFYNKFLPVESKTAQETEEVPEGEIEVPKESNSIVQKDTEKAMLDSDFSKQLVEEIKNTQLIPPAPLKLNKTTAFVAIAGISNGIGATTTAVQLIKYLQKQERTACYIENNQHDHMKTMLVVYEASCENHDMELGYFECEGVPILYKAENINEILSKNYDFIIYDFGAFDELHRPTFLEKDIKILCTGSKPWENLIFARIFTDLLKKDINYLFSFSHKSEHNQIRTMLNRDTKKVYFSDYTPDMFSLHPASEAAFTEIFSFLLETKIKQEPTQEKKGLFRFGRKS